MVSICDYVNSLEKSGLDYKGICDHFYTKYIKCICPISLRNTEFSERFMIIKYFDNCTKWDKWVRQSRGVVLYKNDNGEWKLFRYLLDRGAELLNSSHLENGIKDTDNCGLNTFHHLADSQITIMEKLLNKEQIYGTLSFKVDGSLLGINIYPKNKELYKLAERIIISSNDEFALAVLNKSKSLNLPFIPILSTQGSLFIDSTMIDYIVTAIISENVEIDKNISAIETFKLYSDNFFSKLLTLYNSIIIKCDAQPFFTFSAEAICKNKSTAWVNNSNSYHHELTIAYPFSGIQFLGVSYPLVNDIIFIPHFDFSQLIINSGFKEPAFWRISNSIQINEMMSGLSDIIWKRNNMTVDKFYSTFPPVNKSNISFNFVDYEGFILCVPVSNDSINIVYECNKIKTTEYYKCHKLNILLIFQILLEIYFHYLIQLKSFTLVVNHYLKNFVKIY